MKMIFSIVAFATCIQNLCFATPNWPEIVDQFFKDKESLDLTPIHLGASNTNYILTTDEGQFFLRIAPSKTIKLYADLEIEKEVMEKISKARICAKPLYFDKENHILITEYLSHDNASLSLKDPQLRAKVFAKLNQIHDLNLSIARTFSPEKDIQKLILTCYEVGAKKLNDIYFTTLIPALEKIDKVLEQNPKKSICHLDLHSKNILQSQDQVYLIDWEYATMSHPLLILASMASIERWNDFQMYEALDQYIENPSKEDIQTLYLYRIVADLFWALWNHIQVKLSPTDNPYQIWEDLFEKEAIYRIQSPEFSNILKENDL